MRKHLAVLAAALAILAGAVPFTAAASFYELHLKRYHRPGKPVIIVLQNVSDQPMKLAKRWTITRVQTGQVVARFHWAPEERSLAPDQTAIWEWDQREGSYNSEPSPPADGKRVGPGGYAVTLDDGDDPGLTRRFHVGRFFTVGFEGRDDTFVVFVNERKRIKKMRAEAEAEAEDKRFIVSGLIRGDAGYDDDWSFSMGPASIVLAEAFIEVCDASPRYVERHQDEWMGKRWCPWSSYVLKTGR